MAPKCQDIVLGTYMYVCPQEHTHENMHAWTKLAHQKHFPLNCKFSCKPTPDLAEAIENSEHDAVKAIETLSGIRESARRQARKKLQKYTHISVAFYLSSRSSLGNMI